MQEQSLTHHAACGHSFLRGLTGVPPRQTYYADWPCPNCTVRMSLAAERAAKVVRKKYPAYDGTPECHAICDAASAAGRRAEAVCLERCRRGRGPHTGSHVRYVAGNYSGYAPRLMSRGEH